MRSAFILLSLLVWSASGQTIRYVSLTGTHSPPFSSWATASTNIQDAINVCDAGDSVLLASGTYLLPGELFVSNGIALVGSGSATTIIDAQSNGYRCATFSGGALASKITFQRGCVTDGNGGNVLLPAGTALYDCVIRWGCVTGSSGTMQGGGVYGIGGSLWRCLVVSNVIVGSAVSRGAGITACNLYDTTVAYNRLPPTSSSGGGADFRVTGSGTFEIDRCSFIGNVVDGGPGGAIYVRDRAVSIRNSLFAGNQALGASSDGGAIYHFSAVLSVQNCTFVSNVAGRGFAVRLSGLTLTALTNCVLWGNVHASAQSVATNYSHYGLITEAEMTGSRNCTTNNPMLRQDCTLSHGSPAIGLGTNLDWMIGATDLSGRPRIRGASVDSGAYEYIGYGAASLRAIKARSQ